MTDAADHGAAPVRGAWAGALIRALVRAESALSVLAMTAIVVALSADLAGREFFGKGVFAAQRFAVYCMIVCAMLGFALAVSWGAHMRIGGLDRVFPQSWNGFLARVGDAVSCGGCLFLAGWSVKFVAVSYQQQAVGMSFEILLWPIQAVLAWSFASSALRYALFAVYPLLRPPDEQDQVETVVAAP